jgi:hypothetical protein
MILAGMVLAGDSLHLLILPRTFWELSAVRLADVVITCLLLASSWCIGLAILRGLRLATRIDTPTNLLAIGIGFCAWSWFILATGLCGHMEPFLYLSTAISCLWLTMRHWPWIREAWHRQRLSSPIRWNGFEWFLAACLGAGILLNLIPAFSPEVEYDAVAYHLGALKEYQKAGRIVFLPYNFFASMPSLTQMLYLWGITIRSATVAKLLHGSFALLTAIGLIAFGTRLRNRQTGLIAAAFFYLLPYITKLAETSRIDLSTVFFGFLAGTSMHRYLFDEKPETPAWPHLWLSALAAGLAMSTKYTAAPVVLVPLVVILIAHRPQARFLPRIALFIAVSLVPVMPWLIKNLFITHNPVFPFAQSVFHSPYWDGNRAAVYFEHTTQSFEKGKRWMDLATAAWRLNTREAYSSPILVLLAPLFLLLSKPGSRWTYCVWLGLLTYLAWFLCLYGPWRYLLPAFPWFALVAAFVVESLLALPKAALPLQALLGFLLLFNLNYSFLLSVTDVSDPDVIPPQMSKLKMFTGHVSTSDYLDRAFHAIGWMNANLPEHACVLYVGETCVYYSRHRVLSNSVFDKSVLGEIIEGAGSSEDVLQRMRARGITHIYINRNELNRLRRNYGYLRDMNWRLFEDFLKTHARVVLENEGQTHVVYEIGPVAIAAQEKS